MKSVDVLISALYSNLKSQAELNDSFITIYHFGNKVFLDGVVMSQEAKTIAYNESMQVIRLFKDEHTLELVSNIQVLPSPSYEFIEDSTLLERHDVEVQVEPLGSY